MFINGSLNRNDQGSLVRIHYTILCNLTHTLPLIVCMAFKGTNLFLYGSTFESTAGQNFPYPLALVARSYEDTDEALIAEKAK